jgi:hypothetical protein
MKPPTVVVNLKLAGQGLPIDELQSMLPAAGVKLPHGSVLQGGSLTTSLNIVGPLDALTITGPVEFANTRLAGFNLSSQLKGIAGAAIGDTGNITNIQTLRLQLQVTKDGVRATNIYTAMPAIGEAVGNGTVSPAGALNFKLSMKVDTSPRHRRQGSRLVNDDQRFGRQDCVAGSGQWRTGHGHRNLVQPHHHSGRQRNVEEQRILNSQHAEEQRTTARQLDR